MAKQRTYRVTLRGAIDLGNGGWAAAFGLSRAVETPGAILYSASLDDLDSQISGFAAECGKPEVMEHLREGREDRPIVWLASVDVADGGRKPNGFDVWAKRHELYSVGA